MAATRNEIAQWFASGVERGAAYMLVICDTYDWEDYPAYMENAECADSFIKFSGQAQKVMECYNLNADASAQLNQHRCWALDNKGE